MSAHRIVLPERLVALRAQRLIECVRELMSHAQVVVDASAVQFAEPFGVVTLAAALLRREQQGLPKPSYVGPSGDDARHFLEEIGFEQFVATGHTQSSGTLGLRRVASTSIDPVYVHSVAELIERLVPQTSESVADAVKLALNEMLQNSVQHARSTTDVVVLARWYQQDENVRIAIADSGEGIAESLRRNPTYSAEENDRKLVQLAVTVEGTTSRVGGRFGGLGLKHLHRICLARHGSVHVTSQVVDAHFAIDQTRSMFVPRLAGSTVEIDFRPGPDTGSRAEHSDEDFF